MSLNQSAFAEPVGHGTAKFRVRIYHLINNKVTGKTLCKGESRYPIHDTRIDNSNPQPEKIFENCKAEFNGNEMALTAWAGVGIIKNGKTSADEKIDQAVLSWGKDNYTNWNSNENLALGKRTMTWRVPAPKVFQVPGATGQWMRVTVDFQDDNI